jgi:hypothetical protein
MTDIVKQSAGKRAIARACIACVIFCACAGIAHGARWYQSLNMNGNVISNATTMQSVTGVFALVPQASSTQPVPFWQMTNYVQGTTIINLNLSNVSNQFLLRSGANSMTGPLNAGGFNVTNVAYPVAYNDAATKGYVDAAATSTYSLVSGECDTNRTDVLFSTNYAVTAVYVWQAAATNQSVFVYTNSVVMDAFPVSSLTGARALNINVTRYDRLGIAGSNLNSVIEFCFEGRRR